MANSELLERTMAFIEANPDKHEQQAWKSACATAFCFAGHAAILAGAEVPTNLGPAPWGVTPDYKSVVFRSYDYDEADVDGTRHVQHFAQDELGLSPGQADSLFAPDNTRAELRAMVELLKADPEASLNEIYWEGVENDPQVYYVEQD